MKCPGMPGWAEPCGAEAVGGHGYCELHKPLNPPDPDEDGPAVGAGPTPYQEPAGSSAVPLSTESPPTSR